jgi:signal transduction histidine kinase
LLGKTDFDIHPHDHAEQYWQDDMRVLNEGQSVINKEEPGRPKDGQIPVLLTTKVPLRDSQSHVIGLVGVTRDITEMKRVERQALELALERERINVLRESISNISHDLRTPLSIINTSLYLLERLTEPEKQRDKLETIKHQTTLLEHFIGEILLSAQLQNVCEIDQSPIKLNLTISNIVQSLYPIAEKKSLSLIPVLQSDLPDILGDRIDLERVLVNLIQNAITYTPEGGSVKVRTSLQNDKTIIEVSDTGIGISANDLPYIFDHFYRVDKARSMSHGGMGLGLAIVKRIIEMHNGNIEVESVVGQGTTFRVLLPLVPEKVRL